MTTDSIMRLNTNRVGRPGAPAPGTRSGQLQALVISPDATYRAQASHALSTAPRSCVLNIYTAVDAMAQTIASALEPARGSAIDLVLLDDTVVANVRGDLPADFLAAHATAVVMQRCAPRTIDGSDTSVSLDHRVLYSGVLNDLEGQSVNLSALPTILCFAVERNRANAAARNYNEQLQLIGDLSTGAVLIVNEEGIPCYTNDTYRSLTGMARRQKGGESDWCTAVHPDDRAQVDEAWRSAMSRAKQLSISFRLLHPGGQIVRVRARGRVLPALPGARDRLLMAISMEQRPAVASISRLRAAEQALFDEKEHSRLLLESIDEAVILTDGAARITVFNPIAESITGWTRTDAVGQPVDAVLRLADGTTRQPIPSPVQAVLDKSLDGDRQLDCLILGRSGSEHLIECLTVPVRNHDETVNGALVVFHDQLQSRVVAEHMAYLAYHDVLTGLPNRALLLDRITQAIRLAQRNGTMLALVLTDIDNFKVINDSLGHDAGDELLVMAAYRLRHCVRIADTICRHGGDEYVALLTEVDRPEDALLVAERMAAAIHRSFNLDGNTVRVSMSAGTSVYPFDGRNAKALLQSADGAMCEEKRRKKREHKPEGTSPTP